ncbi:MAG: FAD-dependent oxidoreductase [Deltaproteobacteria bacterium]|nr:FAD-dependent oxidoreductase [Deltaproteobacteria bacterium]
MEKGFDLGLAVAEANRCLLCHDAPCSKGCPADTDPATFIRKLKFKNIKGAIRTIKNNNTLGASCGALCPSANLCEKECSATGLDKPVRIAKIQRFLIEHSWNIAFNPIEKLCASREKVAVVGAGPAGLSCAAELAKNGYQVTIFEEKPEAGGVLRYGVPEHRLSKDFLAKELEDLNKLGVEFKCGIKIKGSDAAEKLFNEGYKAVFFAPGLWKAVKFKNAAAEGLFSSTDFLSGLRDKKSEELKKYIKDKNVAVIGGGSVAIDCAESALKFGAKDVYIAYRRSYAQMPAEKDELIGALEAGVHILPLNKPADYIIDNGKITGIKLIRTKLGDKDSSGRRSPVEIKDSEWILEANIIIEAIGNEVSEDVPLKENLTTADKNCCKTSIKGVFAGGDIVRGPSLVVNAVKDGKAAAESIKKYLGGKEPA